MDRPVEIDKNRLERLGRAEARALQSEVSLALAYRRGGCPEKAKAALARADGIVRDAVYMPWDCNDDLSTGPLYGMQGDKL